MAKLLWVILGLLLLSLGCSKQPVRNIEVEQVLNYKPEPPPQVEPKPVESKPARTYYIVRPNDTLYSIGVRSGYGYEQLAVWNNISPPYSLSIGQKIRFFDSSAVALSSATGPTFAPKPKPYVSDFDVPDKPQVVTNAKQNTVKASAGAAGIDWQWPIQGTILSGFEQTANKGIEIACNLGDVVRAAATGEVVYSGNGLEAYGNLLIIKHDALFMSAYANNESLLVKEGQVVMQGQEVARCGTVASGDTALHFEIRKQGKSVNPLFYLQV